MKSHLVHILPVWEACQILGEPVVRRMVRSLLRMRHNNSAAAAAAAGSNNGGNSNNNINNKGGGGGVRESSSSSSYDDLEEDVTVLTRALFYRHKMGSSASTVPPDVAQAWKRWLSTRNLSLDKAALLQFVVPQTVQPHSGPSGHMGLFDCWVYALQGHAMSSSSGAYLSSTSSSSMSSSSSSPYYNHNNNNTNNNNTTPSSSSTLILFPDILILLATAKQYVDFVEQAQQQQLYPAIAGGRATTKTKVREETAVENEGKDDDQEEEGISGELAHDDSPNRKSNNDPEVEYHPTNKPGDTTTTTTNTYGAMNNYKETLTAMNCRTGGGISGLAMTTTATDEAQQETIHTMALVAFRLYDSYQKRASITRDTIHRFLTDVHGEDSYKESATRDLLDDIFDDIHNTPAPVVGDLQAAVSESQFVARIVDTFDYDRKSHLLLDWLAYLLVAMIPLPEIPPSVTAYLDAMEHRPKPLCDIYQIAESRLFEIRRRFHSMVRAGPSVIHGDPMGGEGGGGGNGGSGSGGGGVSGASAANASSQASSSQPKQSIILPAFLDAVCRPNTELGHGGYLPESLATLVFAAGARSHHMLVGGGTGGGSPIANAVPTTLTRHTSGNGTSDDVSPSSSSQFFWGLANMIQFGCVAVRLHIAHPHDPDIALLRFLFYIFSLQQPTTTTNAKNGKYDDLALACDDPTVPLILTRQQVGQMLLLMIEHTEFRLKEDTPLDDQTDDDDDERDSTVSQDEEEEGVMVDLEVAFLLGILPPQIESSSQDVSSVPLSKLVDDALKDTKEGSCMTFDEFCTWNTSAPDGGASRLAPIIMDLRLIASVLFGVPPTLASMEVKLIAEIERRHKSRYPQTSVSRRGPRGTIWYIIDADWLRAWVQRVREADGTEDDANDGRTEIKGGVRGLGRIENAFLLSNGSLALRQDIQWRHDYEILPPLAWQALQAWYDGGPPIHRAVVRYVDSSSKGQSLHTNPHNPKSRVPTENEIELYPYFVTVYLCDSTSGGEARPFQQNYQLSRVSPVGVMLVQLCKELDVDPGMARLWVLGMTADGSAVDEEGTRDWILSLEQNIVDQRKMRLDAMQIQKTDIHLLLELRHRDTGKWPRGEEGKEWMGRGRSTGSSSGKATAAAVDGPESNLGDGIVGLYNMGNTCFLNSSVQCISHTPIFREYFTSKAYLNDINTTNPLGYQGHLAQVLAVLINSLWKPFPSNTLPTTPRGTKRVTAPGSYVMVNAQSLTPKTFKESLGKFNEHFSGNEQHDAQELLTFLLAGLSEDLNRIVDKPYTEAPDSDGRPDRELADIWWSNHLKRELSIVVALFNGQYKNLLTCRTCKYESARFEPFSTLTVPLPEDDSVTASVVLYPFARGNEPTLYCLRVRNTGNLGDVLMALAKVLLKDRAAKRRSGRGTATAAACTNNEGPEQETDQSLQKQQEEEEEEDDDGRIEQPSPRVTRKAQTLSIVDMKDGYIVRIAPLNWTLRDLQNKETGDLTTMHAYELDDDDDDSMDNDGVDDESRQSGILQKQHHQQQHQKPLQQEKKSEDEKPKSGFLAISQRRSDLIYREYLHPFAHKLFGTPLLIFLKDIDNCTGRQLYDVVAKRLFPLVPKGIHRFLEVDPKNRPELDFSEHTTRTDDGDINSRAFDESERSSMTCSNNGTMEMSMTDSEDIAGGPLPRYGFRLRVTSRDGRKCLICPWYKCCVGCLIMDDDSLASVMDGDSLVVDWHFAVDVATLGFGSRAGLLDPISARNSGGGTGGGTTAMARLVRPVGTVPVKTHASCGGGGGKGGSPGAITLEKCLAAFATEERIPEAYCSKCKDFRVQTTRMTLWRLPPILIIHLKRFQFTPTMRRKLRDLVIFPLEGLDLSQIMPQSPDGGTSSKDDFGKRPNPVQRQQRFKDCKGGPRQDDDNDDDSDQDYEDDDDDDDETATTTTVSVDSRFSPSRRDSDKNASSKRKKNKRHNNKNTTTNKNGLKDSAASWSSSSSLYDLYGVIHHQGALSGGHYVASLKSEIDGQWRLFNDAQIYEIHARDVIDSSAYILFYMRRDVAHSRLSDFWDLQQVSTISEEEMDNLVKGKSDRCVIS